jgi:hypothetical protein
VRIPLLDTRCIECPQSLITEASKFLLTMHYGADSAHKATGASLFGPNASKWPAWWFDAISVIQSAKSEADAIQASE